MARRLQYQRVLFLVLLLAAAFAGLGYRLVELQILRHEQLGTEAAQQSQRRILRAPRRGDILDVRGNLLASSVFVKTVCADPSLLGNYQAEVARTVAPLLGLDETDLCNRLLRRISQNDKGQTVTNRYVVLKKKVPLETWEKIREAMSRLRLPNETNKLDKSKKPFMDLRAHGIFAERQNDQQRHYPNLSLAAQVLGYVGQSEREVNGVKLTETVGKDGIEASFNSKLTGVGGWRMTEMDSMKRELVALRDQDVEPRDGWNVVLTLDSVLQNILETALVEGMEKHTPISISGLVVRPRTGEILAMASLPTFDPNNPGSDAEARRNRVIADLIEPGSTFKIVVVSAALNDGVVTLNDVFNCEHGHFAFAGRVLHDHDSHGDLSVEKIITHSSNIGAAKVGIKLGPDRLYNSMCDYGFGEKSGIVLPGEVRGIVHPTKDWSKVTIAQIPMGHGVAVTRLQMAMAMAAIANGGVLMRPMLVDRLEDRDGNVVAKYAPQRVRRVISETAAAQMVKALKTVVSPEGTAPKAALEHYTVAGKTGTAQKVENGGYSLDKFISSFIGFFPADNPELCISIVMDEPKQGRYGGLTAAPVFKQVAERAANYLNIRPDLNEKETSAPEISAATPDLRPIKAVAARPLKNQ